MLTPRAPASPRPRNAAEGPGPARRPLPGSLVRHAGSAPVVALHHPGHGQAGGTPVVLVGEDVDLAGAPAGDLADRGDDRIVLVLPPAAAVDDAGHEVAAYEVERGVTLAHAHSVADPQGLEPVVV